MWVRAALTTTLSMVPKIEEVHADSLCRKEKPVCKCSENNRNSYAGDRNRFSGFQHGHHTHTSLRVASCLLYRSSRAHEEFPCCTTPLHLHGAPVSGPWQSSGSKGQQTIIKSLNLHHFIPLSISAQPPGAEDIRPITS